MSISKNEIIENICLIRTLILWLQSQICDSSPTQTTAMGYNGGFSGIRYRHESWFRTIENETIQTDLVFDRADEVITVCEIKYFHERGGNRQPIQKTCSEGSDPRISMRHVAIRASGIRHGGMCGGCVLQ